MAEQELNIPKHVGIILDGNRRWAKERNLPTLEGHKKGYEVISKAPEWFFSYGVEVLTVYAFSNENWKRKKEEVEYLMGLLERAIKEEGERAVQKGYKIRLSGRVEDLPGDLPVLCREEVEKTKEGKKGVMNICLNYGGRLEVVDAVKKIVKKGKKAEEINEDLIKENLYNPDLGDPDIIVRTSGERRLSGFQLWQSAYSEFLFLEKYWPEFNKQDAEYVITEYSKRKRRFGGDK